MDLLTEEGPVQRHLHRELIQVGDKLGGWPRWLNGSDYAPCPVCNEPMQMVFQIDQKCNLPFEFGDAGIGHILQCASHKDQLTFTWNCY